MGGCVGAPEVDTRLVVDINGLRGQPRCGETAAEVASVQGGGTETGGYHGGRWRGGLAIGILDAF